MTWKYAWRTVQGGMYGIKNSICKIQNSRIVKRSSTGVYTNNVITVICRIVLDRPSIATQWLQAATALVALGLTLQVSCYLAFQGQLISLHLSIHVSLRYSWKIQIRVCLQRWEKERSLVISKSFKTGICCASFLLPHNIL